VSNKIATYPNAFRTITFHCVWQRRLSSRNAGSRAGIRSAVLRSSAPLQAPRRGN